MYLGEALPLLDEGFKLILSKLSTAFESSPYFLRCYDDLCQKYINEGCRNAMLIGLRRRCCSSDVPLLYNMMRGGYILGEIILSRSSLVGDIYFIYVHDTMRRNGLATILYRLFERVVYDRGASVGLKIAIIRISMKQCIVNSTSFWNKQGFDGGKESAYLTKSINLN